MKKPLGGAIYTLLASTILLASCQKSDLTGTSNDTSTSNTIAVAATQSASTSSQRTATDSVYLLQSCRRGEHRDTVAQGALPSGVASYLSTNYAGYNFHKAFAVKDAASTVTAYVVVIYYNDKPVGLLFDAGGNFVRVLEQREKGDLNGTGFHAGGRFEHRDGKGRDSVALSALPVSVTAFFASNYATDTLVKAFRAKDSSLVVISRNNGLYATVFSATGTFVTRVQVNQRPGQWQPVDLAGLPSVAANYLTTTYPNYVFEKAFQLSVNGTVKGYLVIIDANNTKYAVEFDATGTFIKAKTIH